jgi:rubrerythrin
MSDALPQLSISPDAQGTTAKAGQSIDEGKGRTFPCEGCGADLKFHIGQQQLKCPYCGFEKEIEFADDAEVHEQDFQAMLARMRELRGHDRHDEEGSSEIRCDSCGGTTVFVGPLTSSECPFCGSPLQRDNVHDAEDRVPVDGVLPFLIEKAKARDNLSGWVKSRWFAPNEFRRRGVDGKFNGVYMPYWTYDSMTFTRYSGQRGEHYWVTVGSGDKKRRERRTRWYPASGNFQRFFDDVLVLAARGLNRKLMLRLEPWPLGQCQPFNQEMLAGYLARTYEIELDDGFREAKERIDNALATDVRQRIGGDEQRVHSIRTHYGALSFKHLLLPVWLLAYRFHEKIYQVMINATTGEVQGERPYSWVKITLAVLAGLAVAGTIVVLVKS